ncbi:ceramidase domain-containing protein [Bosea beijingensis]|uniref:ceramidase domain-containing protein n=1 Tax=Bosea beijingensis TaxID=3068632 RepID=UPI002740CD59|nr:ceramidase domain-containing protein [Bosea sp. REN20]
MGRAMQFGYCERLDGSFWAEPLNAVTNAAFLAAAVAAFWLWRRQTGREFVTLVLTGLVFAIGIGSFLFHTIPNRWTLLADVVPIQLFAFGYFAFALKRFLGLSGMFTAIGTLVFFGLALGLSAAGRAALPAGMAGSAGYAAFLLGLIGVALAMSRMPALRSQSRLLALAAGTFAISLTMRSVDNALCGSLQLGTHWFWHVLNALVLYLLLRAAATGERPAVTASSSPGR